MRIITSKVKTMVFFRKKNAQHHAGRGKIRLGRQIQISWIGVPGQWKVR